VPPSSADKLHEVTEASKGFGVMLRWLLHLFLEESVPKLGIKTELFLASLCTLLGVT
jgi:hypothetical protein